MVARWCWKRWTKTAFRGASLEQQLCRWCQGSSAGSLQFTYQTLQEMQKNTLLGAHCQKHFSSCFCSASCLHIVLCRLGMERHHETQPSQLPCIPDWCLGIWHSLSEVVLYGISVLFQKLRALESLRSSRVLMYIGDKSWFLFHSCILLFGGALWRPTLDVVWEFFFFYDQ